MLSDPTSIVNQPNAQAPSTKSSFSQNDLLISQRVFSDSALKRSSPENSTQSELISRVIPGLVKSSTGAFLPTEQQTNNRSPINSSISDIDHISVQIDKKAGVLDSFIGKITFSLPRAAVASGDIKAVRIFRSEIIDPPMFRDLARISIYGMERIRADSNRFCIRNDDSLSILEKKFEESGVPNSVSQLIPLDSFRNVRVGTDFDSTGSIPQLVSVPVVGDTRIVKDVAPYLDSTKFSTLDRSVANDLLSLRNIQLRNSGSLGRTQLDQIRIGSNMVMSSRTSVGQLRQIQNNVSSTSFSDNPGNSQDFKQIAFISPSRISGRVIGDFVEYSHNDFSILYGRGYRYYIVTVDKNMNESVRSRIVQVVIDGLRIPEFPKSVTAQIVNKFVSLNCSVDDQLVEKFEIYRREIGEREDVSMISNVISDASGFSTNVVSSNRMQNGFIQIGEAVNIGGSIGGTFYDKTVQVGKSFEYRVYSVDVFGNKSEAPRQVSVFVPDKSGKSVQLRKPVLLAEVDVSTGNCRLLFRCDDDRVESLFLSRRNLTTKQHAFTPPRQVNELISGNPRSPQDRKRFEGVHLSDDSNKTWNGMFERQDSDTVFIDSTVQIDHTYQYQIFGVDRFGNRTPFEFSRKIFINNQTVVNSPLNLSGTIIHDGSGSISGVSLKWIDGNVNLSSEDLLGNRDTLSANSIRTLFQISRRRSDLDHWEDFPMIDSASFFDPISQSGSQAPNFRPEYLNLNRSYQYRVQAFSSGAFISNSSFPFSVSLEAPVKTPLNFRARPSDSRVRPFYVMLGWDTDIDSGVIDHWEIERAEINNFAAARLNSRNPLSFQKLNFKQFRTVFRESSRFSSRTTDNDRMTSPVFGEHHYMDTQIAFGNSYVYRIKSVSVDGNSISDWAYRGIKVTSDLFERKQASILSDDEKQDLFSNFSPSVSTIDSSIVKKSSSYSLVPGFSSPFSTVQKGVI
jgi:hypothetical protein